MIIDEIVVCMRGGDEGDDIPTKKERVFADFEKNGKASLKFHSSIIIIIPFISTIMSKKVILQYNGALHDIVIESDMIVEQLKAHIYSITSIPPSNQKILGLVKSALVKDDTILSSLDIKDGQKIMVLGQKEEVGVTTTTPVTPAAAANTTTTTTTTSSSSTEGDGEYFEPSIWTQECTRVYLGKNDQMQPRYEDQQGRTVCFACSTTCYAANTIKCVPKVTPFHCQCSEHDHVAGHECLFGPRIDSYKNPNKSSLQKMKEQLISNLKQSLSKSLQQQQQQQQQQQSPQINNNNLGGPYNGPMPTPDQQERMISTIESNYKCILHYENKDLQQKALSLVPKEILQNRKGLPLKKGPEQMRELLNWFKHSFFKWVDAPPCDYCMSQTRGVGTTTPSAQEKLYRAGVVELYQCAYQHQTRFPRYNDTGKLMETRRGRCGEWANTFTLFCRALGYRSRYVHDSTDHVWTEVWIEEENRWVHCDSCEPLYDAPLTYEAGWGKKLAYIFAYEVDGCFDVSRRYTAKYNELLGRRDRVPEQWLENYLTRVNQKILDRIKDNDQKTHRSHRLECEAKDLAGSKRQLTSDELQPRASGSEEWKSGRGEMGDGQSTRLQQQKSIFPPSSMKPSERPVIKESIIKFDKNNISSQLTNQINMIGHCNISSSSSDKCIQLTNRANDQCGAFWVKETQNVDRDWIVNIGFRIDGKGADGMAFVLQNHAINIIGKRGDGLGYDGIENSMAVEFDMYESKGSCADPNGNHISVHCNGDNKNTSHHRCSLACSAPFGDRSINDGSVHQASIVYSAEKKTLSVWYDNYYIISDVSINLSNKLDLIDGKKAWIGMTASTGGINQSHNILEFEFGYL
ncbi:hypothetical protein DFA_07680 [Cavenderia fasciculata]|uniref:Ubiquitin-like domain-containing protein n=1 Tax=Cavenderia fasciculata TaxID=261658 RepID=F4Q2S6_CACFS|nr:uncharacterized protein DFA_07680 [Cavenderia fasciculata]EGG16702.1 hypothetical protein DFA_07680 [Cavenderia fasciculata]|eukprot:XP_004355176.1 hypothetical protein DFA_07680 [Cavenderia fasciculata]